ncbi:MAG: phosphoglycerate dehydrogenase [Desulfovibrio sp.]|nr:phosphoglycerate dehydrogenase [Desulfovibrio sp.]
MHILITPRSFGKNNPELFTRLTSADITYTRNDTGHILNEAEMIERIHDCDGVILGVDPMNAKVIENAPKLKAIAKYGVGTDNIDLELCATKNICVSRTLGANSNAVADYTMTLMLMVARKALLIDQRCRKKDWSKTTSLDLYQKTLGIVGLGNVGKAVAKRALGFSMQILAYDVQRDEKFAATHHIQYTDLDTLCKESDVITLHANLTAENKHLINAQRLELMKNTAILVNTARGDLIDETALLAALQSKRIYGAGLDVFTEEPPSAPAWYSLDNLVFGSHTSSSTLGATATMGQMAVDNLLRDLKINT